MQELRAQRVINVVGHVSVASSQHFYWLTGVVFAVLLQSSKSHLEFFTMFLELTVRLFAVDCVVVYSGPFI